MSKQPTLSQLDQLAQDYFARITNRMIWESKRPREYGTKDLLSQSEIEIIDRIAHNDGVTVTLVAKQLAITKSAVSQLVSSLEKKKYLKKVASPDHGKKLLLKPLKKAIIASAGLERYSQKLSHHFSGLTRSDFESYIKACQCIESFLDEIYAEDQDSGL